MSLQLPAAPATYDQANETRTRAQLLQADRFNRKTGQNVDMKGAALYLYDSTGKRYIVGVSTAGALTVTAA